MKNILFLLFIVLVYSCNSKQNNNKDVKLEVKEENTDNIEIEKIEKPKPVTFENISTLEGYEEYKLVSSSMVEEKNILQIYFKKDKSYLILLTESLENNQNKIVDSLHINQLEENKAFMYYGCIKNDVEEENIFAVVTKNSDPMDYATATTAWGIDLEKKRIKIIDLNKNIIKCAEEQY